jgi:tetratricopeptide (TPR) repeat protein
MITRHGWQTATILALGLSGCATGGPERPTALAPTQPAAPAVDPTAATERASEELRAGRLAQAEASVLSALASSPDNPRANRVLAELRARQGAYSEAATLSAAAFAASEAGTAERRECADWAARMLLRSGDRSRAAEQAKAAAAENPDDVGLQAFALRMRVEAGESPDAIIAEARKLLERDETHVHSMSALAAAFAAKGQVESSNFVLSRALEVEPQNPHVLLALSSSAHRRGELRLAIDYLQQSLDNSPEPIPEALNALGAIYQEMGDNEGARAQLERATAVAPGFAEAWLNLGSAHRGLKNYALAEEIYRKVLLLGAGLPEAHYNLGVLYLESPIEGLETEERLEKAIAAFEAYKAAMPAGKGMEVAAPIDEARRLIEVERKRREAELRTPEDEAPPGSSEQPDAEAPPGDAPASPESP